MRILSPVVLAQPLLMASRQTQLRPGRWCPACESTERKYKLVVRTGLGVELLATVRADATLPMEVIDYPRKFLDLAQTLLNEKKFEMAVVAAHMASEVVTIQSTS
jgi:hypothetical protein